MATYTQPVYRFCFSGLGSGFHSYNGPLYYSFFDCAEDWGGCPFDKPWPDYDVDDATPPILSCNNSDPGGAWVCDSSIRTFGASPSNPTGELEVCLWVNGATNTTPGVFGVDVSPDFVLNASVDFPFTFSDPNDLWAVCGRQGASVGFGYFHLDPLYPDCECNEAPHHCVDGEWDSVGGGCFCDSFCPNCLGFGSDLDFANGLCKSGTETGTSCPPGTWWDPVCLACVSNVPPRKCWRWEDCQWKPPIDPTTHCTYPLVYDPATCQCVCASKACNPSQILDRITCECIDCTFGQCYCMPEHRCVVCTDPPCKIERSCYWDTYDCSWHCIDDPDNCSTSGGHYDLEICGCVPDCPDGECWCNISMSCIPCPDPDCKSELECVWDIEICDWACEDPPCLPGATWTGEPQCKCTGLWDGPANLITAFRSYHAASADKGILYQRSEHVIPPFASEVNVTTSPKHKQPRMVRDWRHRTFLLYTEAAPGGSSANILERVSDDDGATWSNSRVVFVNMLHPMPAGPHPLSGCIVYAAYNAGGITAVRRYPGDTADSAPFSFKNDVGANLSVDNNSFGLRESWDGPGRWLLHVLVGGTLKHYQSWDDCQTWTEVT